MKKIIYLLLGVLMFWSCAETYEIKDTLKEAKSAPKEIKFSDGILTNTITKGVIENDSHLQAITLGVFAKINTLAGNSGASSDKITYDASQHNFLIYNDQLSYTNKWAATKTYFWPKTLHNIQTTDPTVNFYAYGPYDIGTTSEANGIITVTGITATGKNENAKDFVYGSKLNQTYDLDNSVPKITDRKGYVDFTMAHQMSWISFEAKKTTNFENLTITKLDVVADNTTAEFKINTTDTEVSGISAYSAKLTNESTPVSYTYEFTPNYTVTDAYHRIADLIALPQTVSNNMTATITYTAKIGGVTYTDRVAVLNLNGGTLTEDDCHSAPWAVNSWDASNKYTYHINFEWEEIKFTASVTQWTETGNYYRIY